MWGTKYAVMGGDQLGTLLKKYMNKALVYSTSVENARLLSR